MNLLDTYSPEELLVTDIQFLGLTKRPWEFSRGARTQRLYEYPNGDVAVRDSYSYVYDETNREIISVTRLLEWFDSDQNKFLEKDISPDYNIKGLRTINREIRQGRIDYMEAAGLELSLLAPTLPEPFQTQFLRASYSVDIIMKQYEVEINHYIARGTLEFENIINNETNPIMVEILDLMVRPPDAQFYAGLNIRQTIIHQLTGEYNP